MNPHSIAPTICFLLIITVSLWVLFNNPRSKLNRSFFIMCFAIALWNAFYISYNLPANGPYILLMTKACYFAINFIPMAMLYFLTQFYDLQWIKSWNRGNLLYGIIVGFLILFTPYIINGLNYYPWGHYPKAGTCHPLYLVYFFILLGTSLVIPLQYLYSKEAKDPNKVNQTKYILSAFFILIIGAVDYIPNYGIDIYPKGHLTGTIYIVILAIAIVKHKLMDIEIVYKKSLIYTILITIITLFYLSAIYITEHLVQSFLGYKSILISLLGGMLKLVETL